MKTFAKQYWRVVLAMAVLAIAAVIWSGHRPGTSTAKAQSAIPSAGLNLTWSGSDIQGVGLTLSGSGPFTENFQFAICFQEQGRNSNRIDCAHTPWAASTTPADLSATTPNGVPDNINSNNYPQWWSAWSSSPEETIHANWTTTTVPPNGRVDNWEYLPTSGGENCSDGSSGCTTCYDSSSCAGAGYYYDYGSGWTEVAPSLFVRTAPLPAGVVIRNVQMGFEQIDDNDDNQMWNANASHNAQNLNFCANAYLGEVPWIITPVGGGAAVGSIGGINTVGNPGYSYGYTYGDCDTNHEDSGGQQSYFRVYMSGEVDNAAAGSNNIPALFSVSQSTDTGTDGNPLSITVLNTGNAAWVSDISTVVPGSTKGTCDADGGTEPSTSDPEGSSCTYSTDYSSDGYELQHVSGAFGVGNNPAQYHQIVTKTCTVGPIGCTDAACNGNVQACVSAGYCSNGYQGVTEEECQADGGQWTPGCSSTWEPQISCNDGGDPNVEPGATTKFTLGSLTAPATAGSYTEDWQMENGGGSFGTQFTIPITVTGNATPTSTGVVNVASEDSQTGSAVTSSFDVLSGATDLCGSQSCTAQSQTFTNVPLGVTDTVVASSTSANGFAFGGTREEPPIAKNGADARDGLFALSKNLFFGVADALNYCGYFDSDSTQCPIGYTGPAIPTLTPTASTPTVNFILLWDPEATMSVTPATASATLSAVGTIQTVTISNTSNAPGSELGWTANVSCAGVTGNCPSNADWLSITPFANADPNGITSSSPETATIGYTGGLEPGKYQAAVDFKGYSISAGSKNAGDQTVPVTLTVTNSGGAYFACGSGVCEATSTPGAASCAAACSGSTPRATCSPASIALDQTTQCELDLNGVAQDAAWKVVSGSAGSIDPSSGVYTPSATGTEFVSGSLPDGTSAQATINVTSLPSCTNSGCQASCTNPSLTASPSSIVVPESSNLSFGCSHVTECQLTQGSTVLQDVLGGPSQIVSSTYTTSPSISTAYTLTCVNGDYNSDSTSTSVKVIVGGSSRCEQNPNGTGCQ